MDAKDPDRAKERFISNEYDLTFVSLDDALRAQLAEAQYTTLAQRVLSMRAYDRDGAVYEPLERLKAELYALLGEEGSGG